MFEEEKNQFKKVKGEKEEEMKRRESEIEVKM
jgi:hypothetical protein